MPERYIVIAGPFPPPLHGFSAITQAMATLLSGLYKTTLINLSPHTMRGGVSYHLRRLCLTLRGSFTLMRCRAIPSRTLYIACEGNLGLIYTLKLALAARLLRYPLFLHHHSFGYIEKHSLLMQWLVRIAGPSATHIFLCDAMAARFAERYRHGSGIRASILSNSAFVPPAPQISPKPKQALVVGLLSNLTEEKGLTLFLDVLREGARRGMAISGILAGPVGSDAENAMITAACGELGTRLAYLGAVYDEAKQNFFRSIDVFVFPTRYANEAEPTVLFEALAHGIPLLSYDRGCICSQVRGFGATLEREGAFVPFALDRLQAWLDAPERLAQLRLDAQSAFTQDHALARRKAGELFA